MHLAVGTWRPFNKRFSRPCGRQVIRNVEPVGKGGASDLPENDPRIWLLSNDLGSGDHLGTPKLAICLVGWDFFYRLVRRHRMESFPDTFIRGTIRRCGGNEP